MIVDDISLSIWEPIVSKQMKLEQILSLKTSQERPMYREFATRYTNVMRDILAGEVRLLELSASSKEERLAGDHISTALMAHKDVLSTELGKCSITFGEMLKDLIANDSDDDLTCSLTLAPLLSVDAKVVCWLRLVSIILNHPRSAEKFNPVSSFGGNAQTNAEAYLSERIAAKVASLGRQLVSSRQWTEKLPERNLWEGTLIRLFPGI